MNTGKSKIISLILVLSILLSLVPVFHVEAQARTWSVNQQNIADRADFFFNATWVCQKTVYGWRDQFTYYEGETYHLPYGQPVNSGKFIGYGVELEEMLLAAADADSVFYSRQSEFNGWTSVYYATDCAAFVAMCWGTVRQDCSTLPYYSTYKGSPTESNIHNVLQLGDALDSTSVGHVVLVTDMIYDDSGELIQIEITEQTPPQLKRTLFTPAELAAKYAAEFGIYRYGGSVPAVPEWGYTAECNPLASYCKIEATEDCIVRSLPCSNSVDATSTELGSVRAGDILTATRLYENTVGELWYRIEFSDDTEGYIPAAGTKYLEQILEDIALTDSVAPNAHVKGTTYALVGNIYAKYNQLVTASAYIYQGFGTSGLAITGAEDYVTGNAYTLKSSNIDYSTSMGSLSTGKHTYAVSATYRNYYATGADSYEMNSGSLLLAEDYFMVISQSVSQTSCRHNYSETTLSAATCTQGQKTVYACATCGSVYTEEADAPGHAYGGWVETSPGCTESGFQTRSCTVCGNVETQVLPATGHDYIATEQAGDCTQHPCTAYTCSQCGDEYKIYSEDLMSEWLEALPEGIDPSMTESKLQYRQSALETVTSPESTLDGYYYISESWETAGTGKVDYVVTWPSGFDTGSELYAAYNNTPITGGEDESGLTKTVIDSTKVTGYLYYHWCYDGYPYTASYKHDSYNTFHAFYSTTDPATHDRYDSSDNSYSFQNECCDNSSWFFVTQVTTQSYTNYQKQFTHGKWSEFSQWQDEEIIASDTVKVETRTLYRYVNAELGDHNFENNICTVCGAVCEHDWTDGSCNVCGTICEHDWTDGTCGVCGAVCEHDWTDGTCGVCGAICEHTWTDGTCGVCGAICEHTWTDGSCNVCGAVCDHDWTDGTCGVCGMVCTHSYENNVCTVCGQTITTTPSIYAKNVSLAFEDEILLNIYFTVSDLGDLGEADMGLLTWTAPNSDGTIDNANAVIPGAVYHSSLGMYSVRTQGIAAKNLSDTVYFKIYLRLSDGSYLYTKQMKYSPITYANNILAGSQHSTEMKTLVVAMLNYGAAAQVYFDYKADQLMNAHLTEAQLALVEPYRSDMIDPVVYADKEKAGGFPSTEDGFIRKSASISFEGAFSIQYYYQPSTTVSGKVQFYYWTSTTYQAVEYLTADNADGIMTMTGEGILQAKVTGIAAKNLDDTVYVAAIYSDGSALYCSGVSAYSIGQYCLNKASIESDIQPLAAATAVYGYYAKALLLK